MGHLVEHRAIAPRGLLFGLALFVLATSCFEPGAVRQADLVREPAHEIRMPGAVELAHVGR